MKKKGRILTALASVALVLGGGFALTGCDGSKGNSAEEQMRIVYADAQTNGYTGTYEEWLASIKGEKGDTGMSAYELAKYYGFQGTEQDWLISLRQVEQKKAMDIFKLAEAKLMQSRSNLKVVLNVYSSEYDGTITNGRSTIQFSEYEIGKFALLKNIELIDIIGTDDEYYKSGAQLEGVVYNIVKENKNYLRQYYTKMIYSDENPFYEEEANPSKIQCEDDECLIGVYNFDKFFDLDKIAPIVTLDALSNGNYKVCMSFKSTKSLGLQDNSSEQTYYVEAEITRNNEFVNFSVLANGENCSFSKDYSFEYGTVDKELIKAKIAEAEEYAASL